MTDKNRKGGGRAWGRSVATGLEGKPVGGCHSAEMRRPAIRSTAHAPTTTTGTIARESHR